MAKASGDKRRYGRSWKRWVAIYLVAGAVIYGVIYLVLQSGSGSGGLYG